MGLLVFCVLSPATFTRPEPAGLRLGADLPFMALADPHGSLRADEVAAMPEAAFTRHTTSLNKGYTNEVHWLRVAPSDSDLEADAGATWLQVLPTYLDHVTLYQLVDGVWQAHESGDAVPMAQRERVREIVLPLVAGQPFLLRIHTSSPLNLEARLWRSSGLMSYLASNEWASGVHQGINFMHALLIIGAAIALRMRTLVAMATASVIFLLHGAADRGYLQLWLPASLEHLSDLAVKVGTLVLPAAMSWMLHEVLTRHPRWRHADRLLIALSAASLLCLVSIPLGRYSDWAWLGVGAIWAVSAVAAVAAWSDLLREGPSLERVLLVLPSTAYGLLGIYMTFAYLGLAPAPDIEASVLWQLNMLLLNMSFTAAVGTRLVRKFRDSVERLARSEQSLEERVRQRTTELLQTQNTLQLALASERTMREEQRQFFDMVNHEFRTPLSVMDSAAIEQWTFPTPDLEAQKQRAAQMRRMCRQMSLLVDNCLAGDRMEAAALQLRRESIDPREMLEDAAEIARWSKRHKLVLDLGPLPPAWPCDPTLVRIALSNLADNAVKYAHEGKIRMAASLDEQGHLRLSVSDEGPGLSPETAEHLFERGQRGDGRRVRGFGLGLWTVRRIAELHGGDVEVSPTPAGGTCFALVLPPEGKENPQTVSSEAALHPPSAQISPAFNE